MSMLHSRLPTPQTSTMALVAPTRDANRSSPRRILGPVGSHSVYRMRNVFQAISYIESEIVRNMLVANGIPATVNRQSASRAGIVCSEVWVIDDTDGDRAANIVRDFQAKQQSEYQYVGNRAMGIVLQAVGAAAVIGAVVYLPVALPQGDAITTSTTAILLAAFGVFLFHQGRLERSKAKPRDPSPESNRDI